MEQFRRLFWMPAFAGMTEGSERLASNATVSRTCSVPFGPETGDDSYVLRPYSGQEWFASPKVAFVDGSRTAFEVGFSERLRRLPVNAGATTGLGRVTLYPMSKQEYNALIHPEKY